MLKRSQKIDTKRLRSVVGIEFNGMQSKFPSLDNMAVSQIDRHIARQHYMQILVAQMVVESRQRFGSSHRFAKQEPEQGTLLQNVA